MKKEKSLKVDSFIFEKIKVTVSQKVFDVEKMYAGLMKSVL